MECWLVKDEKFIKVKWLITSAIKSSFRYYDADFAKMYDATQSFSLVGERRS